MEEKELVCPKCNGELKSNFNYCPICGEPLNDLAKKNEKVKEDIVGLRRISEFAKFTEDANTLQEIKRYLGK